MARDCELRPWGPRQGRLPLMIGSNGPRVLRIAAPYVQSWNSDWTMSAADLEPTRPIVDAACLDVGRDPATLERTAGVMIDLPVRVPGVDGRSSVRGATAPGTTVRMPPTGTPEELATLLCDYADAGISHVQVWLDPSDLRGLDALAPVLELADRS